jgi:hypothetical protein
MERPRGELAQILGRSALSFSGGATALRLPPAGLGFLSS